jgi:hypothetical protein
LVPSKNPNLSDFLTFLSSLSLRPPQYISNLATQKNINKKMNLLMKKNNKDSLLNNSILFVKDVKLEDLIDYENSEKISNREEEVIISSTPASSSACINIANKDQYERIKERFTGLQEWDRNNILCWYCCCNFINKPVFIPKIIKDKNNIDVYGNFCSFSCTYTYICIHYNNQPNLKNIFIDNLKYLYKLFTGKPITQFTESPPREGMKKFGGERTEYDYKELIKTNYI